MHGPRAGAGIVHMTRLEKDVQQGCQLKQLSKRGGSNLPPMSGPRSNKRLQSELGIRVREVLNSAITDCPFSLPRSLAGTMRHDKPSGSSKS